MFNKYNIGKSIFFLHNMCLYMVEEGRKRNFQHTHWWMKCPKEKYPKFVWY